MLLPVCKTTLFIVADEKTSAVERDDMKVLAAAVSQNDSTQTYLIAMKVGDAAPDENPIFQHSAPVSDAIYARLPRYSPEHLLCVEEDVTLIGVGSTTLPTLLAAKKVLEKKPTVHLVDTVYISRHRPPENEHILTSENIKVFSQNPVFPAMQCEDALDILQSLGLLKPCMTPAFDPAPIFRM